jgi:signal transduction histidine kinase
MNKSQGQPFPSQLLPKFVWFGEPSTTAAERKVPLDKKVISTRIFNWFVTWRWWLIGLFLFIVLNMQVAESLVDVPTSFHLIEFLLFLGIILIGLIFLEMLLQGSARQARTLTILDYKHRLSLALAGASDWEILAVELARFPVSVAKVQASCLFIRDGISGNFEHAADWQVDGVSFPEYMSGQASIEWVNHVYSSVDKLHAIQQASNVLEYCLPIRHGESILAFLRFCMVSGQSLQPVEMEIFENVGDEMALALLAGQSRKTSVDLHSSQVALADRHNMSQYLHDHLGQNLGYLRLKLDQLLMEGALTSPEMLTSDLYRLREAANDSYEIVRGALENIHPRTMPHLMNVLREHANKVSERAQFKVNFVVKGRPVPLKDDVQSAIFYVCHEVLSNVEKHSQASRVDILADWQEGVFQLTISDNGVGFSPESVNPDMHFGLEIVHERVNNILGHVILETSHSSGTKVIINIPLPSAILL